MSYTVGYLTKLLNASKTWKLQHFAANIPEKRVGKRDVQDQVSKRSSSFRIIFSERLTAHGIFR